MTKTKNKVILYISMTLDWYISRVDWKVDFLDKYHWTWEDFWYWEFMEWIWSIIMWNTTYKEFWWTPEFDEYYKNYSLYVFSHKNKESVKNIEFVNWNLDNILEKINSKNNDKDIWLLWWAGILKTFLDENLVDKMIISVLPEIIWKWIKLFNSEINKEFKLLKSESFKAWIVNLTYEKL
jgi:dihydrofolate reductase